jgi:hypothetical protein
MIIITTVQFSQLCEEFQAKDKKLPPIYVENKLVTDAIKLPFENTYEDDEEWGKICLFPKCKYKFMFSS